MAAERSERIPGTASEGVGPSAHPGAGTGPRPFLELEKGLPQTEKELSDLDPQNIPAHVAVIMDGNGRWGKLHGLDRNAGHRGGVEAIRRCVQAADDAGVKYLSLYSFSTENLGRPAEEVSCLFGLFSETLDREVAELHRKNVRVVVTGLLEWLPEELAGKFRSAIELTKDNDGLTLNLCVMYSGRAELVDAVKNIAAEVAAGTLDPNRIDEKAIARHLYRPDIPDPDVVIRTSGEQRVSNFLLWQIAYSELVFSEVLWPDFSRADFVAALLEYQQRSRRFGGV
jgi:undecaprenyl diphosphate synthase